MNIPANPSHLPNCPQNLPRRVHVSYDSSVPFALGDGMRGGAIAMSTVLETPLPEPLLSDNEWPAGAGTLLSAPEAGAPAWTPDKRRRHPRRRYRVVADLRLFGGTPGSPQWRLFTRDVSVRG